MAKRLLLCAGFGFLFCHTLFARIYNETEAREAWKSLTSKPLTEITFRQTCDLLQDVAQTNIKLSYELLDSFEQLIKKNGDRQWMHVVLMGWAKAKESLTDFTDAEKLYARARVNAIDNTRRYDEAIVGTILMYLEWSRTDSLQKYLQLGEKSCRAAGDTENLSFIFTFRAMSNMSDTAAMRRYIDSAILLSNNLIDKNAVFTARYNRAIFYSQYNLEDQVSELESLLNLAKDSTIAHKPRLYERTAFTFRNGPASIYYQLALVNLLLTDYDNAWKFTELFHDAIITPNPEGPQAPYFTAVMALVKAYQGEFEKADSLLNRSLFLFHLPEDSVTYPTYQLAAGLISARQGLHSEALKHYEIAFKNGSMSYGLHLMPPAIYYAHELIVNHQLDSAARLFASLEPILKTRKYSAIGFYYYKYYAELLRAKHDASSVQALETFYTIKDSLASMNQYRAIQEVETRMRVREKELEITRLNEENARRIRELKKERIYLIVFTSLAAFIFLLLAAYSRTLIRQKLQAEEINRQNVILQQIQLAEIKKQHRIDVMQGAMNAEERERHKIADQLHDEAGSMLALASLNISSALENDNTEDKFKEKIERAYAILTGLSTTIRNISHRLTPLAIEREGFKKAISDFVHSVNLTEKLKLDSLIVGFDKDSIYPVSLLNDLYRIIQELTHNILKHAGAREARLECVEHQDSISLMVEDDGRGISSGSISAGNGLAAIRARIAYLNGHMEIQNKREGGTLIVMEINTFREK